MAHNPRHGTNDIDFLRLVRLNLSCDRFESSWRSAARPAIEDVLREYSETERAETLAELLPLELEYRSRLGETPHAEEYLGRFPEHAEVIATTFRQMEASQVGGGGNGEGGCAASTSFTRGVKPSRVSVLPVNSRVGDFELLGEIGRGGMGVVYKARQVSLDRVIALKMILSGELADAHEVKRFQTEAKAAASLRHPGIVAIHEVGEEAGRHFFAMDYIEGPSLAEIQAAGPMPPREAARLIATIGDAVHHAHQQGVIHRDLKPANILLDSAGQPHITDFGLARRREMSADPTITGQVLGTPSFIPPEQAVNDSAAIGPTSDVYSLGALLYTLLTGRPPFQAATIVETLQQVIEREAVSPRQLNPAVPVDLETICLKCLEKSPALRLPTAAKMADELRRFLQHEPIHSRPISPIRRAARWCRRRPASAALIAVSATAVILAGVGLLLHDRQLGDLNRQLADALYAADIRLAARALAERDLRTVSELLDRHIPTSAGGLDRRGFEWHYLRRQATAAHHTLLEVTGAQYFVCFSPDQKLIAAAGQDAIVRLLDAETGKPVREIVTGQGEVNGLAFSPDGKELATAGDDGSVRILNVATGHERLKIPGANPEHVFQVVFIPGKPLIACCGEDPLIRLFDTETAQLIRELPGHSRTIQSLAMDADGRTLVSTSSDGTGRIWDLEKMEQTAAWLDSFQLGPVAIDTRHDLVVVGGDDRRVWTRRASDGREISHIRVLDNPGALALHPGARLLAGGESSGSVSIWKLDSQGMIADTPSKTWHAHRGNVYSLAWSADGTHLLSAGADGRVFNWSLMDDPSYSELSIESSYAGTIALIPDSSVVVRAGVTGIEVLNWRGRTAPRKLDGRSWLAMDVSADGKTLAAWTTDGILGVWNAPELSLHYESPPAGPQLGFALAPDGRTVAVSRHHRRVGNDEGESSVCLYDTSTGDLVKEILAPTCSGLAYSPDGQRLAIVQESGFLILKSVPTTETLWRVQQTLIRALAFSPDGKWLAAGSGREAIIRDAETGTQKHRLVGHLAPLETLTFAPNGRTLATGAKDGEVRLWHVATGRDLLELHHATAPCRKLQFTNDGRHLAALIGEDALVVIHAD